MRISSIIALLIVTSFLYTIHATPIKRASTYALQLIPGPWEYTYFFSIKFGDQMFNMQFDTGSAQIWVPEIKCTDCGNKNKFDPDNPTGSFETEHKPFEVRYGMGEVSGYIGTSDLNIGD